MTVGPLMRSHPRAQELGEQAVVAVPAAAILDHEAVDPREPLEHLLAVAGDRLGQFAVQARHDRGAQHEAALARGQAVERLGDQEVAHQPVVARELGHEALGVVAALEAERRHPQARGPALGARVQHAGQARIERELVRGHQRSRPPPT